MVALGSGFVSNAIDLLRSAERHEARHLVLASLARWREKLRTSPPGHFRRAIHLIHRGSPVPRSVRDLSLAVGVSERQLQRIFRDRTGVTPKVYLRFFRFERAFLFMQGNFWASLATTAFLHDYTDAAHLIREFHAFARSTPQGLLRGVGN
ncbi:transcriptional regulator GlxA family with amidase domain [Lewinella aquimaris]|uniref:Transcriptional regulator GlxA family with amidase domain n=1 Tax=Neolewinella aquimaris TaxID=1835722 RepID=A0A840E1L9_9BACT|nr:AraC family transcriptional regulator [Neolewinella aquimaris]MBB4079111.1 transcriptional regulator GlxA family with amidase domain [Neolewinella aquimaris]